MVGLTEVLVVAVELSRGMQGLVGPHRQEGKATTVETVVLQLLQTVVVAAQEQQAKTQPRMCQAMVEPV